MTYSPRATADVGEITGTGLAERDARVGDGALRAVALVVATAVRWGVEVGEGEVVGSAVGVGGIRVGGMSVGKENGAWAGGTAMDSEEHPPMAAAKTTKAMAQKRIFFILSCSSLFLSPRRARSECVVLVDEGNVAHARNGFRVVIECFMEVAEQKHDDAIGKLLFMRRYYRRSGVVITRNNNRNREL